MKQLKEILGMKGLFGWFVAGMISLGVSSLFVLVYNYSGTHIVNLSGATDYKWIQNQYKANWGEGVTYMRMDDNGFNNLSSDISNIDLLLMGGSNMEAISIDRKHNAGVLLNNLLGDMKVYNIGMSGHQLTNCLDNLEAAIAEFCPSSYIVVQTSSLDIMPDEIKAVLDGTLSEIPSYDSGILYQLQKIPALKVIYKQVMDKLSIDRSGITVGNTGAASTSEDADRDVEMMEKRLLMNEMLTEKAAICEKNGIKLILAYTPTVSVGVDGNIYRDDDEAWVRAMEKEAADAGITIVDCYEAFRNEYENTYALPYGFHNATMGAGHLNMTGHRIVALEVAKTVEKIGKGILR